MANANSGYESKLSEAILSRFTIINVDNYEEEEEERAIIDMVINEQKIKQIKNKKLIIQ